MILFGGYGLEDDLNDTWAYDASTNTWTELHPAGDLPSPRDSHNMCMTPPPAECSSSGGKT